MKVQLFVKPTVTKNLNVSENTPQPLNAIRFEYKSIISNVI